MNTQLRKFNPGLNQDDNNIKEQFVVRLPMLKALLEMIEDNFQRPINQHALYFGPRGRGKTMLMARISAELRTNKKFNKNWLPIRLMEESYYEIEDTAGFWIEILATLIQQLPNNYKENANKSLQSLTDNWSHPNLEEMGRVAVLEQLEIVDKKAVIIIENLHQLLKDTNPEFGWYLRKIMQNEPQLMIIATSTTRFQELDNAKKPFYDIFATNELCALTRKDAATLWNKLTNEDKTEQQIAPVNILTGGSPRLITIIADFAKNNKVTKLLENLTVLIDEHTEYFRSQLESLAPKERRVFTALADLWKESTTSEIAQRARLGIRTTSSLLSRLVHKGAVIVNSISPRKKYYTVSERLFCIYYKLRRQHNYHSLLDALVQFMIDFYSPDEIQQLTKSYESVDKITSEEKFVIEKLKTEQNRKFKEDLHKLRTIKEASKMLENAENFYSRGNEIQFFEQIDLIIQKYEQENDIFFN